MQLDRLNTINHAQSVYKNNATSRVTGLAEGREENTRAHSDRVTISAAGRNAESTLRDAAEKYDLTNISGKEVRQMARELYDKGAITATEMFDMYLPTGFASAHRDNDKRNHLENMEKDFNMMKQYGKNSAEAINGMQNVLEMLRKIG